MKSPRLIATIFAFVGIGALYLLEKQSSRELQEQVNALRTDLQGHIDAREKADSEIQKLQRQLADRKSATGQSEAPGDGVSADALEDDASSEIAAGAPNGAAPRGGMGGFAKAMGKMFTDPDMKKMMRSQQTAAVQMLYGELPKELKLSPEESTQVMELLADRQLELAGASMQLLGDEQSGAPKDLAEAGKAIESKRTEFNAKLENILGKDRFAEFQNYESGIADRMQITQYKQAFSASGLPLEEGQSQELLAIMQAERVRAPAPSPFDANNKDVQGAIKAMQSPEMMNNFMASQQDLNHRVLERARGVLSVEQAVQLETIQKQQLEIQQMGLKMSQQLMQPK